MLISTKGRYALRVIVDMAENIDQGFLPLKDIAKRQELSEKYLENIIKFLVQDKIVEGVRGKGGGYRLMVPANELTVGRVLRLTEGTTVPVSCLEAGGEPCERAAECKTLPMWVKLDTLIQDYLDNVTIEDMLKETEAAQAEAARSMLERVNA